MSLWLKQSTAVTVVLGPFVDATDGVTAETALTVTQSEVRLSKNAGAFAQKGESTSLAHMENGYYTCLLNTTDTGTLGRLRIAVNESGAIPVWQDFMIVSAAVYEAMVGTGNLLDVTADAVWDELTSGHLTAGTFGQFHHIRRAGTAQGGAVGSITLDAGASSTSDVYNEQIVVITGGTGTGQARVIFDYNGTSKVASTFPNWFTTPDATSVFMILPQAYMYSVLGSVGSIATGGVTAASFAANALTAAALAADAVAEIQSGLATQASVNTIDDFLDTELVAILAAVDTEITDIKAKTDNLPADPADASVIATAFAALPTAAEIADAVLDDTITEPGGVFAWGGATLRNIVGWMGLLARNKMTQDSTETIVRNDADNADIASSQISEVSGTFTRGEWT